MHDTDQCSTKHAGLNVLPVHTFVTYLHTCYYSGWQFQFQDMFWMPLAGMVAPYHKATRRSYWERPSNIMGASLLSTPSCLLIPQTLLTQYISKYGGPPVRLRLQLYRNSTSLRTPLPLIHNLPQRNLTFQHSLKTPHPSSCRSFPMTSWGTM